MKTKTVVITGATAGIGRATASGLAELGADLVLLARNKDKAAETAAAIRAQSPATNVAIVAGDLASMASVRSAGEALLDVAGRIDVLVNNAGIVARHPRITDDGFDEMLASNYLGPFLLTHLVMDRIVESAPARIVNVGSEAHRFAGPLDPERFEDFGSYAGITAQARYGRTKLLDMLFTDELARRLAGTGVTVNSLCPGFVATDLAREMGVFGRLTHAGTRVGLVRTPERGARMTVHLASSPEVDGVTGRFHSSTAGAGFMPAVRARRDPAIAARVYERTCEMLDVAPLPRADPAAT